MIFLYALLLLAFFTTWSVLAVRRANRRVDQMLADEFGYTTPGAQHCRCDWMGAGTPEHDASPLCIAMRPGADRDEEKS